MTPETRAYFPLAKYITPATRVSFPLSIYGEGVADRPGVRSNARNAGVFSPRQIHYTRNAGVFPPRQIHYTRNAGVFPLSIYGEGVADRPGVRSGGGRQAGGEVRPRPKAVYQSQENF